MINACSKQFSVTFSRKPFFEDDRDDGVSSNGLNIKRQHITSAVVDEYFAQHFFLITKILPNFSNRLVFKGPVEDLDYNIVKSICFKLRNLSYCLGEAKVMETTLRQHLLVLDPDTEEYAFYCLRARICIEDLNGAILRLKKAIGGTIKVGFAVNLH